MSRNPPAEMPVSFPPLTTTLQILQTLGGLACAGLILAALTFLRVPRSPEPVTETYTAHLVTLPFEEPPPPPREQAPPEVGPVVGPMRLEIVPAASVVHIQVPDFPLLNTEAPPPPARAVVAARFDLAKSIAHPVDDGELSARRIFDRSEVDQRAMVLYRVQPNVTERVLRSVANPRVTLLLVVDTDGSVGEVRLMRGSQVEDFDQAMIEAIREWRFSPAIRKGHKVRQWVEQAFFVKPSGGASFEVH